MSALVLILKVSIRLLSFMVAIHGLSLWSASVVSTCIAPKKSSCSVFTFLVVHIFLKWLLLLHLWQIWSLAGHCIFPHADWPHLVV